MFLGCVVLSGCGVGNGPSVTGPADDRAEVSFLPQRAEKGDLFEFYLPKQQSQWRRNWTSRFDLTGVSWNDQRTATLIAPSYVVMAAHFTRPQSEAFMFHDKKGRPYERYIIAQRKLAMADIAVAKLHLPLLPEIKRYSFASAADAIPGRLVIVTDQTRALSVHRIAAVSGRVVALDYFPGLNPVYGRKLISGDSGNPSFIIKNGDLRLLETHTTGGPGAGPFYGDPEVQAAIRNAIAEMGG